MAISRASGLRLSSSFAAGSTGSDSVIEDIMQHDQAPAGPTPRGRRRQRNTAARPAVLLGSRRVIEWTRHHRRTDGSPRREPDMSRPMKYGIAGVIVGLILLIWAPWAALGVIAAAIIIPAIAYAMLDPSQRRRVRRGGGRRSIGSL